MARIIFLTLYLGLIAGRQPIALQVDGPIKTVHLMLDGAPVGIVVGPSWRTAIDLGDTLQPRELVAVGLDEKGNEVARATQILNLPRPIAETAIVIAHDAKGTPTRATLTGRHIRYIAPREATLKVDDVEVWLDKDFSAALPPLDMKRPHVFSANVKFSDGTVAHREEVIGGQFGETVPSELTAIAVTATNNHPTPGDCVISNGQPLRVTSIEEPTAKLIVVRDPDNVPIRNALMRRNAVRGLPLGRSAGSYILPFPRWLEAQLLWPVADHAAAPDQPTAILFPFGPVVGAADYGLYRMLAEVAPRGGPPMDPRQWADAVSVAGVSAMDGGKRRAVLLVISDAPDKSIQSPKSARAYLKSIGVPLYVWSATGPRPELADTWGPVTDVSTIEKMGAAGRVIYNDLAKQRIAWVDADPFTALRATVKEGCGFTR